MGADARGLRLARLQHRRLFARAGAANAKDLLDPKWKGKLGVSATEATLTNWVGAMVVSEGEDFVRKLGAPEDDALQSGRPAVANLVVSGEVPLLVNSRYSHMYRAAQGWAARWPGGRSGLPTRR